MVEIRLATEDDLAGIEKLLKSEWLPKYVDDDLPTLVGDNSASFIAVDEGNIVGHGNIISVRPDRSHLRYTIVDSDYSSHGIGNELVKRRIDWLGDDYKGMTVGDARTDRTGIHKLLIRHGFWPVRLNLSGEERYDGKKHASLGFMRVSGYEGAKLLPVYLPNGYKDIVTEVMGPALGDLRINKSESIEDVDKAIWRGDQVAAVRLFHDNAPVALNKLLRDGYYISGFSPYLSDEGVGIFANMMKHPEHDVDFGKIHVISDAQRLKEFVQRQYEQR